MFSLPLYVWERLRCLMAQHVSAAESTRPGKLLPLPPSCCWVRQHLDAAKCSALSSKHSVPSQQGHAQVYLDAEDSRIH